jgi:YHS domain-containing protein
VKLIDIVLVAIVAGCGAAPPAPVAPAGVVTARPMGADLAYLEGVALAEVGAKEAGSVKVFRNAAGQPACPVMGNAIVKADEAISFTDHQGTRYFFCCDSCEKRFLEDPAAYADGKYLADHGLDPTAECDEKMPS